jgi:class 3 adenylate cyclase
MPPSIPPDIDQRIDALLAAGLPNPAAAEAGRWLAAVPARRVAERARALRLILAVAALAEGRTSPNSLLTPYEIAATLQARLGLRRDFERSLAGLHELAESTLAQGVAHVARCIELGADDFLHKPVNPVLLKARVGASVEKKRLRDQQKELVRRFATSAVALDLERSGFALGGRRARASVMFADIRGFTSLVDSQPPEETIELLDTWHTLMLDAIGGQGGVVNQMMIGDGLMAIFGAPLPLPGDDAAPLAAVRAALDMSEMVTLLNAERASEGKAPIAIGVGIASGEVIAGYTGTRERATYTCVGDTVNLAARLERNTKACARAILVDGPTPAALGGRIATEALAPVALRGKSAPVVPHAVTPS